MPLAALHHSGISAAGRLWCLHRSHGKICAFYFLIWKKQSTVFVPTLVSHLVFLLMFFVMIAIRKSTIVMVNFNWHQLFDLLQLFWVAWVLYRSQIQVMVMAVYSPGNVEISTTISIGVIGVRVCPIEYLLFLSFFATKKTQVLRWWWWWSSSTFGSALCPFTRAWKRSRTLGLTRCQCQEKGDCHCYIICIPHIFPYWYTTALFRPIKVHQKVRKFATK